MRVASSEESLLHATKRTASASGKTRHMGLRAELSGARADVWAWHFISHASAPEIC
jgi:hypothetical protein